MTLVRSVVTYLGRNEVAERFYTYDGNVLTMVKRDGSPVVLDDGPVTETVAPYRAEAVAKRLTRVIRRALLGETVEGFSRRIEYPRFRVA